LCSSQEILIPISPEEYIGRSSFPIQLPHRQQSLKRTDLAGFFGGTTRLFFLEIMEIFRAATALKLLVAIKTIRIRRCTFYNGTPIASIASTFQFGAEIDFLALKDCLPFVARQIIVPILGDLIPDTSWGSSLANLPTAGCWDKLRQRTFALTGFRCEICRSNHNLECHELWEYHEPLPEYAEKHACSVQRLIRLIGLCSACHETHHPGSAQVRGRFEFVRERITAYNRWSEEEFQRYFEFLIGRYERRSNCAWVLEPSCVADTQLLISGKWRLQDNGFLCCATHTGDSETMVLGASWQHAEATHPVASPELAYCE
jgi:hypothetical protein